MPISKYYISNKKIIIILCMDVDGGRYADEAKL